MSDRFKDIISKFIKDYPINIESYVVPSNPNE